MTSAPSSSASAARGRTLPGLESGARGETGDGGEERQRIVRQLGRHQLEDEPARHDPSEAEAHRIIAATAPYPGDGQAREQREGPEGRPEGDEEEARRRAVGLLHAGHLADEVVADRFGEEGTSGLEHDGNAPRQHEEDRQCRVGPGLEGEEPAPAALQERKRGSRKAADHQDDRTLDQDAETDREPEDDRRVALEGCNAPAREKGLGKGKLCRADCGKLDRICRGEPRLHTEKDARRQHHRRRQSGGIAEEPGAQGRRQQHRNGGTQHGGHAVGPDGIGSGMGENRSACRLEPARCRRAS